MRPSADISSRQITLRHGEFFFKFSNTFRRPPGNGMRGQKWITENRRCERLAEEFADILDKTAKLKVTKGRSKTHVDPFISFVEIYGNENVPLLSPLVFRRRGKSRRKGQATSYHLPGKTLKSLKVKLRISRARHAVAINKWNRGITGCNACFKHRSGDE